MNAALALVGQRLDGALRPVDVRALVIAGWTGRDPAVVEHHIRELQALGIPRPRRVPLFYRVAAANLTSHDRVEVCGTGSTGEVEFVIISTAAGLWIGVGSDHTDRVLEKHSVTLAKQVCAKPIAAQLWHYEDLAGHWDELELSAHAEINGERRLYQRGSVSAIREPAALIAACCGPEGLPPGTAMFCGTLPVEGDLAFATRFEIELIDRRLGRSLRHVYCIDALPLEC